LSPYESILQLSKVLLAEADPDRAAELLLAELLRITEAERGLLVVVPGVGPDGALERRFSSNFGADGEDDAFAASFVRRALDANELLHEANVLGDRAYGAGAERPVARSVLVAPLVHAGKIVAVVYLDRAEPSPPIAPESARLVRDFAELAGLLLGRAVERDALEKRSATLERELAIERARIAGWGDRGGVDLGSGVRDDAPPERVPPPWWSPPRRPGEVPPPLDRIRREAVRAAERAYLEALIQEAGGNISAASRKSGIHRSYLQRLMTRHGLR
jgi:transcriptional regulator with GAF, ATPase, and Fis domain